MSEPPLPPADKPEDETSTTQPQRPAAYAPVYQSAPYPPAPAGPSYWRRYRPQILLASAFLLLGLLLGVLGTLAFTGGGHGGRGPGFGPRNHGGYYLPFQRGPGKPVPPGFQKVPQPSPS
jgi:hypothetical protein